MVRRRRGDGDAALMATLTFYVYLDSGSTPPPDDEAEIPSLRPICQTYQGYAGTQNSFTSWVRGDTGKADFTDLTLSVALFAYGASTALTEVEAESPAVGQVDWTIPAATQARYLPPGLYRVQIKVSDGESEVTAHGGILEIV